MQKFNSGGKEMNEMLDEVSVWIMPRMNPDGTMTDYEGDWNRFAITIKPGILKS